MRAGKLVITAAAVAAAVACGQERRPAPEKPPEPPRLVRTAEVRRSADAQTVAVPGWLAARVQATLTARIASSVADVPYREGEAVAPGAVLVRLEDAAPRAAVEASQAEVTSAEAELRRMQTLVENGVVAARELEQAQARAEAARARREAAREDLSYAVLRAPFGGRLSARHVDRGDIVAPGAPLVEIEATQGLEIRAAVEAALASEIRVGERLRVRVDGRADTLVAVVRSLSPAADVSTHRFEVRADLLSAEGLRSGAFARLLVPDPRRNVRVQVPESALFRRGGLDGLFVVADGRARLRWVALGEASGGMTEVRAGLEGGERVVIDPQSLGDGAAVEDAS